MSFLEANLRFNFYEMSLYWYFPKLELSNLFRFSKSKLKKNLYGVFVGLPFAFLICMHVYYDKSEQLF